MPVTGGGDPGAPGKEVELVLDVAIGAGGEKGLAAVTDHIQSGAEQAFIGWKICGDPVGCRHNGDVRFETIIGGGVAILHSYAQRCVEPREEACILSDLFPGAIICCDDRPALLDREADDILDIFPDAVNTDEWGRGGVCISNPRSQPAEVAVREQPKSEGGRV